MRADSVQFLSNVALSASILFVPNLARELGATDAVIGVIVSVYAAAMFVSSYVFGRFSDVYGRNVLIKIGLGASAITFLLQVLADPHFAFPLLANPLRLAITLGLAGFSFGIFPSALAAYVYESTGTVGKFGSYGALGNAVGNFVAGIIALYYGIFALSSACLFSAFLVAFKLNRVERPRVRVPFFPRSLLRRNWRVYVPYLLRHTGANCIWVIFPLYIASLGADRFWIGAIYTINVGMQFVFMRYVERFKETALINAGLVFSAITFLSYTISQSYVFLLPVQVLLAASYATIYVGSLTYLMRNNPEKATSSGILSAVINISQVIGSLLGGAVSQIFSYTATMYVAAVMTAGGFVLFRFGKKPEQESTP